jgi:glycogen phosphorylase
LKLDEMPVIPLYDEDGRPLVVRVELPKRTVAARLWKVQVGRVNLYLMDTNESSNNTTDQQLTSRLYSSDLDVRISQEILLGIGGVRVLRKLNYHPDVWHMNEGHSAFLCWSVFVSLLKKAPPLTKHQPSFASRMSLPPILRFRQATMLSHSG